MAPQTLFILLAALAISGCSSMRSTLIHRAEDNTRWEKERFLHGVPVTVKVPTHLKVTVLEHFYLTQSPKPQLLPLDVPVRSVATEVIRTEKIFTVDAKRPGAGTMNATFDFQGQYFRQIDYDIDDDTIEAITALVKTVAQKGLIGVPAARDAEPAKRFDAGLGVTQIDSVVATAIFDLDSPDLEVQVASFLEQHLNACHTCQVVPPGAELPQRLPAVPDPSSVLGSSSDPGPSCFVDEG